MSSLTGSPFNCRFLSHTSIISLLLNYTEGWCAYRRNPVSIVKWCMQLWSSRRHILVLINRSLTESGASVVEISFLTHSMSSFFFFFRGFFCPFPKTTFLKVSQLVNDLQILIYLLAPVYADNFFFRLHGFPDAPGRWPLSGVNIGTDVTSG